MLRSPLLLIVLVIGLIGLVGQWRAGTAGPPIGVTRRAAAFGAWLGLAVTIGMSLATLR